MRELNHGAVEVGVNPTPVCAAVQDVSGVMVQNISDVPVFVGSSDVAVDGPRRGIVIGPGEDKTISSYPHDANPIYAVIADKEDRDEGADAPTATVVFMMSH